MPWPTLDDARRALASAIKCPLSTLPEAWGDIVPRAMTDAKSDIYDCLGDKGFDVDLIDQWDDLATYATRQTIYWCIIHGTGIVISDFDFINAFDMRKQMSEKSFLRIGGKATAPPEGGSEVGGISHGRVAAADLTAAQYRAYGWIDPPCGGGSW